MPKPPPPPDDWLDISRTDLEEEEEAPPPEEPPAKPVPIDNWSLVRTASGQSGWVLSRRLVMAIPDEVAQYAEGHRIVSYFSLGKVRDGDQQKDIWLWTTSGGGAGADFDSFRVFNWSVRRHRYETAYIERRLKGYLPVLVQQVDLTSASRSGAPAASERYPGFSVCIEKADGQRYRREYAMLGNIVRYAGERPCEAAPAFDIQTTTTAVPSAPEPAPKQAESFTQRVKRQLRAIFGG
jgi:hypothetical protein